MIQETDILIIGGGSAGFGAAYRAVKSGECTVTVVEQNPGFGGTSTYGGVNCWEPGYGGKGVHHILAERLQSTGVASVAKTTAFVTEQTPWGVSKCCDEPYYETLERSFRDGLQQRRFQFEPQNMAEEMLHLIQENDTDHRVNILFSSVATDVELEDRKITAITVRTPQGDVRILPKIVLDCSGDIVIARKAGCAVSIGEDSQLMYREPNAPDNPQQLINGLTQVFRVTPCDPEYVDEIPSEYADVDLTQWKNDLYATNRPVSCFNYYPNGDININMLPTLPGETWLEWSPQEVAHVAQARVYAYWNWVQTKKQFRGYRIKKIFPMLGIRESYRLIGRYVLKEQDLRNGYSCELGASHTIAYADHPADIHGRTNKSGGATMFAPYGIPYECMLPKEIDNMLVACRGASFSHIASSSARLSRTMMALGEAAGEAAVQCIRTNRMPDQVDIADLRDKLDIS